MIKISCEFVGVEEVAGVRYYTFTYRMFALAEFFDMLSLGLFGTISDILDVFTPDLSLLQYLPQSYSSGQSPGHHLLSESIYLLGAEITGSAVLPAVSSFLVSSVVATYTQFAPDASGVTFLPEFDEPDPAVYWKFPVVPWSDYPVYIPLSGFGGLGSVSVYYRRMNRDYCHYNLLLLGYWSGAIPTSSHFLAHLADGSFSFLTEGPNLLNFIDNDSCWYGNSGALFNPEWVISSEIYHYIDSVVEFWNKPCYFYASPPLLRFSPPSSSPPSDFVPSFGTPFLPDVLGKPSLTGRSGALSVLSFQPFVVDGELFSVDGSTFEVKS